MREKTNPIDKAIVNGAKTANRSRFVVGTASALVAIAAWLGYVEIKRMSMSAECDAGRSRLRAIELEIGLIEARGERNLPSHSKSILERDRIGIRLRECARWGA